MQELIRTKKEKVLLVVVDYDIKAGWRLEDISQELTDLISNCRGEVVDTIFCRVDHPTAAYLIREGKVKEIADQVQALGIDTVVFSHDLKGSQQRNLEEVTKVKTIDRTQLILDIFARHAVSQEGKIQVELAQLEYLLPRLVGQGIALSRLGGGIGTLGPGETKLEVDRRRIGQRIAHLKRNLQDFSESRLLKRKKRQESGVPAVSIVGYTNAGKTTLFNRLTESEQLTRNSPFTTLDSVARQFTLPNNQKIVITDTVGFMQDLPHHLIESFKATLEHVKEADLLLHVLDISNDNFRNMHQAVLDVLAELKAEGKPVITVTNKIDKLKDKNVLGQRQHIFDNPIALSALTAEGYPRLIEEISEKLSSLMVHIDLSIPISRMDLVNLVHEEGQVISIKYHNDCVNVQATLPSHLAGKFYKAQVNQK
jgi:GTPase